MLCVRTCTLIAKDQTAERPTSLRHALLRLGIALFAQFLMMSLLLTVPVQASEELVGLQVGKHHLETLLVHKRKGRFWLPIDETSGALSVEVINDKSKILRLATPLGVVTVPSGSIYSANATRYLDQRFLETKFNAKVWLLKGDGVIAVNLPWRHGDPIKLRNGTDNEPALEVEAVPPTTGVSTVHGDVSFQSNSNSTNQFEGYFRATGHAYGGVWQAHYEEDLYTRHRIRDAIWMKQLDDNRFVQIGHQSVSLHPLLESIEMTGLQYAWTNVPAIKLDGGITAGALLSRRVEHQRTFDGRGPVGGRAELWLDGLIYAQTPIGLAGTYSFASVHLPTRRSRIEIRIFDRRDAQTPVNIIHKELNVSDLLMDKDQFAVMSGIGRGGNSIDEITGQHHTTSGQSQNTGRLSAFALGRYAISDDLTVEGGVTADGSTQRVMAGVIGRLAPNAVGSASVAYDRKADVSYLAELEWRKTDWQLIARSYWKRKPTTSTQIISNSTALVEQYDPDWDHFLELAYAARSNLRIGIIARAQPEATFILPFARWHPNSDTYIEARPDHYGIYRIDGRYRLSKKARLFASYYNGDGSVSYSRMLDDDITMTAQVQRSWQGLWRAGLKLSSGSLLDYELNWNVGGYVSRDGNYSLVAGVRRRVHPGVQVYAEAQHTSTGRGFFRNDRSDDLSVRIGMSFDLALTQGDVVAASSYGLNVGQGSLAGKVQTGAAASDADLSGIAIKTDGRIVGHTKKDGSFFLPHVDVGTRFVEFDDEKLPIEYVATKKRVVAKITPGAVTTVRFTADVEYGAAGQVTDAQGNPVTDAVVAVFDAASNEIDRTTTNGFGYYRLDALKNGRYQVQLRDASGKRIASRAFSIKGDYVFGIDIAVK